MKNTPAVSTCIREVFHNHSNNPIITFAWNLVTSFPAERKKKEQLSTESWTQYAYLVPLFFYLCGKEGKTVYLIEFILKYVLKHDFNSEIAEP